MCLLYSHGVPDPRRQVTVGGATANLTVNGVRVKVLAHTWAPAEMRRVAGATGLPAGLEVSTAVRMPLFESAVLLELTVANTNACTNVNAVADGRAGGRQAGEIAVDIAFETPFVTRWFDEIESGYECCSPHALPNGGRNLGDWTFGYGTAPGFLYQTALDSKSPACTVVAVPNIDPAVNAVLGPSQYGNFDIVWTIFHVFLIS